MNKNGIQAVTSSAVSVMSVAFGPVNNYFNNNRNKNHSKNSFFLKKIYAATKAAVDGFVRCFDAQVGFFFGIVRLLTDYIETI